MTTIYKALIHCAAAAFLMTFAIGCNPPASDTNVDTDLAIDTGEPEAGSNVTESSETPDSNTTTGSETPAGGETPE